MKREMKNMALGRVSQHEFSGYWRDCIQVLEDDERVWAGPDSFAAALAENLRIRLIREQATTAQDS